MVDYGPRRNRNRRAKKAFSFDFKNPYFLSKLTRYALFGFIGLILFIPILFFVYSWDLPTPGKLVTTKYNDSTHIYDRKGVLLYSVYKETNRTYETLDKIPKNVQLATIAIEDKDFYKHGGFDPLTPFRILYNAVFKRRVVGGSTLTQQLVKNVLLQDASRTPSRKIKELILAIQVDQRFTKDQILEMYLNNVPYGGTAIGVEAAAETYFGKKAKDLDLAESAFIAGLPQSPSVYSPYTGDKYYLGRTEDVLTRMVDSKYITEEQKKTALNKITKHTFASQDDATIKAPHFVMYIKQKLAEQFGESMVERGGLQVTTTLDYEIQKKAETIVEEEIDKLEKYHVGNGAAIVRSPSTGEILSMVGSKDYFDTKNSGNYNVAIHDSRQPGSSLKPIIYAAALEKGYTAASMLMDTKTNFKPTDADKDYLPVNYDGKFHGPMQMRFSLGNSLNITAVKMLAKVGLKPVMQKGYDMGLKNWEPTNSTMASVGLSLVLGGRETSLLDETTAYGVFANGGIKQEPVSILKVTDNKGKVLYEWKKKEGPKVLSPEVSFIVSHMLLDNKAREMEFGPSSYLVIPGKTVSVKTGTTDEKRDNWTIGYTPSFVVGVWVGNNDNSPMNQAIASGVTGASPIWHKIMVEVLKGKPDEQPNKPDNVNAMIVDSDMGGLPRDGHPTRSEYFIKGTEPTSVSPVYQVKDGKEFYVFKEDDPISTDGKNRWQEGINDWIESQHKGDEKYHPPDEIKNKEEKPDDPTPTSSSPTATPEPSPTP